STAEARDRARDAGAGRAGRSALGPSGTG
ncbi:MAG: hypothetical protein JWM31_2506, partial [Solirubrobacterales bacterium]|nr:hypothetical protein [Solirubrobacterales bacterium]